MTYETTRRFIWINEYLKQKIILLTIFQTTEVVKKWYDDADFVKLWGNWD